MNMAEHVADQNESLDQITILFDVSVDEQDRVIEAILFASPEPLTLKYLSDRVPLWGEDRVVECLERLVEHYEERGLNLVCRGDAWAFRTAPDMVSYLTVERHIEKKLSRASMETLAIIAYHQPVTRAEIENIRGVAVGKGTLDILIEAGWVQPGRRREVLGRPLTWKTSASFLDHFGLENLKDLPGIDDLKASGLLDRRPSFEIVPDTMEMFGDNDDDQNDNDNDSDVQDHDEDAL
jgi:segregation and condensation protein B